MKKLPIFAVVASSTIAVTVAKADDLKSDLESRAIWHGDMEGARHTLQEIKSREAAGDYRRDAVALGYTTEAEIAEFSRIEAQEARKACARVGVRAAPPAAPEVKAPPTAAAAARSPVAVVKMVPSASVVSAITGNRWNGDTLIVSGTLTNTNAVPVRVANLSTAGFDKDQKVVIAGSDYTIIHNDLTPGETVDFKAALKDGAKQIRFVKVTPNVAKQ